MTLFGTATVHYADWVSLDRQFFSTWRYFDLRIVINGPFKGCPLAQILNPLAYQFYPKTLNVHVFGLTEAQQRNIYLQEAQEHGIDWLLILDSDEYITVQDFEQFRKNAERCLDLKHNVYGIKSKDEYNDYSYSFRPRLWYRPWELEYSGCHYCFKRRDGREIKTVAAEIEGITIEHDKNLRSQEYIDNWKVFREYQVRTEEHHN